jgi:ribulose-bisphosphate carboxylase large chain
VSQAVIQEALDRIEVDYRISSGNPREVADAIRVEQTIEFPFDLAPEWIQQTVVGRIDVIEGDRVTISYDPGVAGGGVTQLLNVLWGNVSLFPGVRIIGLRLPEAYLTGFRGPRFGVPGLRELLDAPTGPLICTAVKPMGTSPQGLGEMAGTIARAGFHIIKDDHGLADQPWARWTERVRVIADHVNAANEQAGTRALYMPSLNVPADRIADAAHEAKAVGAKAVLVLPGVSGFDAMRMLADDDSLALPIMAHPSFLGSNVVNPAQGFDHGILFGTLMRVAGADISIFPNYGGRFSFSPDECRQIKDLCHAPLGTLRPSWPSPGGGMTLDRLGELTDFYGSDVALLIGGALHRGDLAANSMAMVTAATV